MQEAAKCLAAEGLIFARVENELVPKVIGDLGRHRHETPAAAQISQEELAQAAGDQRAVLAFEASVLFLQPVE
ncbi:MAG: hypothetical protein KIT82_16910 [Bradyrhizobium sp.]|nr:hypothetical protein [Bradyrhizobium sp.]